MVTRARQVFGISIIAVSSEAFFEAARRLFVIAGRSLACACASTASQDPGVNHRWPEGHDWRATTPVLRVLEDTGKFEVWVTDE